MNTHITTPRHFRLYGAVLAMAALLAVLLAVTLTAGPAMAQDAGGILVPPDPRTGDNEDFYDAPYPCSEESQPDSSTVSLISEGYYAVFDAFWDYEVGHLSDNFCPPKVTVTTKDDGLGNKTITHTRSDANIHVTKTAFSIPDSYKVTVVDSAATNGNPSTVTGTKIDLADYPFLRKAVSAVKPGPNDTTVFADNKVWWVRLNEPDTPNTDETSPLKIGFSSALLKDADWYRPDGPDEGTEPDPPVQFHFGAVHVLEAGVPQEIHVVGADFFAFEERATDTPLEKAQWSNLETAAHSDINMAVGKYRPMQFLFTKPGEYRVQAQIQGHVRKTAPTGAPVTWKPINPGDSVTSPTEWYVFHVGPVADVGVTLTHTDETSNDDSTTVTDGTASFSVTAANSGPATATGVVVEVDLPQGLDYVADASHTGVTYECGVISWRVGDLTASGASSSKTLSFTASVGANGHKSLTVDAEVHSPTVDDNRANNTASVVVKTNSTVVTPPFFPGVSRDMVERAVFGAHAGDPVAALNPDGRTLTYSLSGRCSGWFQVDSDGQITLGAGRTLDYDEQLAFHLTLHVSDGVNDDGTTDTAKRPDDDIPVTIRVIDTPHNAVTPTVNFSFYPDDNLRQGESTRITAQVAGLTPDDGVPYSCIWTDDRTGSVLAKIALQGATGCHVDVSSDVPDYRTYTVHINWPTGGISATSPTVEWWGGA